MQRGQLLMFCKVGWYQQMGNPPCSIDQVWKHAGAGTLCYYKRKLLSRAYAHTQLPTVSSTWCPLQLPLEALFPSNHLATYQSGSKASTLLQHLPIHGASVKKLNALLNGKMQSSRVKVLHHHGVSQLAWADLHPNLPCGPIVYNLCLWVKIWPPNQTHTGLRQHGLHRGSVCIPVICIACRWVRHHICHLLAGI